MSEIIVSAPGKVILHGEHAVVYGTKAIAAGLDLRTFLRLRPSENSNVSVNLPDIDIKAQWTLDEVESAISLSLGDTGSSDPSPADENIIAQLKKTSKLDVDSSDTKSLALVAFLYLYIRITQKKQKLPALRLDVKSNLPTSAGLGSSAAYSVCLASALLSYAKLVNPPVLNIEDGLCKWNKEDLALINKWAFMAEKIIHGNPSGIDNSVSAYGGALSFQKGENPEPMKRVPKLSVLIMNTKIPRSTKALVAGLRTRHDKYPDVYKPLLDSIQAITERCEREFSILVEDPTNKESYTVLEELITLNQGLLQVLGVSHPQLERIVATTNKYNVKSKLTGAGGGGCAFALICPDVAAEDVTAIKKEICEMGFDCWQTTVGGNGVVQHDVETTPSNTLPF